MDESSTPVETQAVDFVRVENNEVLTPVVSSAPVETSFNEPAAQWVSAPEPISSTAMVATFNEPRIESVSAQESGNATVTEASVAQEPATVPEPNGFTNHYTATETPVAPPISLEPVVVTDRLEPKVNGVVTAEVDYTSNKVVAQPAETKVVEPVISTEEATDAANSALPAKKRPIWMHSE